MAEKLAINWEPPATIYMYQADLYCRPCGKAKIEQLNEVLDKDVNGTLDWSNHPDLYEDSDSWPQEYSRGEGESDSPDHCGNPQCSRFLGRHLTDDGIEYVKDLAAEELDRDGVIGEIVQGWLDFYEINVEGRYLIAEVLNNGEWGILEEFEATDDGAANDYADEHYSHIEWYVLYQSTQVNING